MRLNQVVRVLEAEPVVGPADGDPEITAGCAADLMSDVLNLPADRSVLLTGLMNPQVVRAADIASVVAVVFVQGKRPPVETVELAQERGIPLFSTRFDTFEACGRLYVAGLPGPTSPRGSRIEKVGG